MKSVVGSPLYGSPPQITQAILDFAKGIDAEPPEYARYAPDPDAKELQCIPNVRAKVFRDGGAQLYGWSIMEWTGVLLEAQYHSIWRSPDGELIDITPQPDLQRCLFARSSGDLRFSDDCGKSLLTNCPHSRYKVLTYHQMVYEYVETVLALQREYDDRLGGRHMNAPTEALARKIMRLRDRIVKKLAPSEKTGNSCPQ